MSFASGDWTARTERVGHDQGDPSPVSREGEEEGQESHAVLEPSFGLSRFADDLVARCLDDLADDWQRKGGRLSYDDVTRMTTKRALDANQVASLLGALSDAGVAVSGLNQVEAAAAEDPGDEAAEGVASADRDALGTYLRAIGRYPLLWAEDEVRLGRLIKTGQDADAALSDPGFARSEALTSQLHQASQAGRRAHADLVRSNLRLVVSMARARKYASSDMELLDLIQEGNLGLLRAADKFDYTLGYKFSTYATWWIRQSIERGIADHGRLIRLPVHFHEKLLKVLRMQRRLTQRSDREPTLNELATALDMDPGEVQAVLDWAKPTVSIDSALGENGDVTLGDLLAPDADVDGRMDPAEVVLTAARQRDIEAVLDSVLDTRSALIVRRRFGIGGREEETLEAIGQDLGLTRERIRQLTAKALEALAGSPPGRRLYEYLVAQTRHVSARPQGGWPLPEETRRRGGQDRRHPSAPVVTARAQVAESVA